MGARALSCSLQIALYTRMSTPTPSDKVDTATEDPALTPSTSYLKSISASLLPPSREETFLQEYSVFGGGGVRSHTALCTICHRPPRYRAQGAAKQTPETKSTSNDSWLYRKRYGDSDYVQGSGIPAMSRYAPV